MEREIKSRLDREGHALIEGPLSQEEFLSLGRSLGTIVQDEPIRLFESERRVHQPERIELHTDPPHVDVIAWLSIVQDEPIATEILGFRHILDRVPSTDLPLLERVVMTYPDPVAGIDREGPLISNEDGQRKMFCIPWYAREVPNETAAAWKRFLDALHEAQTQATLHFTLAPGQALLLNNRTHLHGRAALPPTSKRHLRRLWIENRSIAGVT